MKLLFKLILVGVATLLVLVGLRTLGQMIHPGATHYWVAQPSSTPSVPEPDSIPGLTWWWVSSDLDTNVKVTNWVDRQNGGSWTNANIATQPTNSTLGVHFVRASSLILTNQPGFWYNATGNQNNTNAHWFIIKLDSSFSAGDFLQRGISDNTSDILFHLTKPYLANTEGASLVGIPMATGAYFDMLVEIISTNGQSQVFMYTNGVLATNTTGSQFFNFSYWGSFGGGGNGYFDGYVYELGIWTNSVLTNSHATLLHTYATNKYGYTP